MIIATDPIDDATLQSPGCTEAVARRYDIQGQAQPPEPWQSLRAHSTRQQTQVHLRKPKSAQYETSTPLHTHPL